ncbi:MAG: Cof-type HAD-IIB family hydrolase [Lentilactobacillus diolivorans]|nr:Cof-type HAD-IIB family hydrolase [Lentilactobacillus diolivorans]
MMVDKLAFFDLDGTLCDNGPLSVTQTTFAAIQKLKHENVLPVIATGRSYYEVHDLLKMLDLHTFILANGCYIVHDDQVIQNYHFPINRIKEVLTLADQNDDVVGYFNQQGFAISGMNPVTRGHVDRMRLTHVPINHDFFIQQPVNFLNLFIMNTREEIYQTAFKNQLSILRYAPDAVDVMPIEISKAQGIQKIKKLVGHSNIETFAFGDQNNDLSMFSLADYGIAMKQATLGLKQRATYVAQSDHGVLEGLKHYGLI